jgi:hypothetical protein
MRFLVAKKSRKSVLDAVYSNLGCARCSSDVRSWHTPRLGARLDLCAQQESDAASGRRVDLRAELALRQEFHRGQKSLHASRGRWSDSNRIECTVQRC